jgi:hypothetical protein
VPYHQDSSRIVPATISLVIAIICAIVLTIMIHDRWYEPEVKSADQAEHATTGSNKAGARLLPTDPKLSIEPTPSAPALAIHAANARQAAEFLF